MMYQDEDEVIADEAGFFIAAKRKDHLEVWNAEGDFCVGNLPLGTQEDTIRLLVQFFNQGYYKGYQEGHLKGLDDGKASAKMEMLKALGLDD
jgi:flagellar biosynthesis/type III secretory pathway protein FliH